MKADCFSVWYVYDDCGARLTDAFSDLHELQKFVMNHFDVFRIHGFVYYVNEIHRGCELIGTVEVIDVTLSNGGGSNACLLCN